MKSTNHTGWQVESYYSRHTGWRRATRVFPNYVDACKACDRLKVRGRDVVELRIMEALHPAPLTPAQYITEALRGAQRFYRINERKA